MAHVEDAARVLELLNNLGLKGPRLAVFDGDSVCLAKQVADRLAIENGQWLVDFLKYTIGEAVASRDLELRLNGEKLPDTHQRISDALIGLDRREAEKKAEEKKEERRQPPPKKGKLAKLWKPSKVVVEDEGERKSLVVGVLLEELKMFGAPILGEMQKSLNPERAVDSLLGRLRPSTVRRYLSYWQGFRRWIFATSGKNYAVAAHQLADYLYAREEEGMGCSIPMAIMKSVSWFEKVACVPEEESLVAHPLCKWFRRSSRGS